MTERERWIVYPLLFLALGAALRDKLSEQTNTKLIRCQELVVVGEEVAGQEGETLVHIGAMKRTSADSPHLGQILVNGLIQAQVVNAEGIQAEGIQAGTVNADNYFFQRVPFAPLLRAVPGVSPTDWLRALQQQQAAGARKDDADEADAPTDEDNPTPVPANKPPTSQPTSPVDAAPTAD